MGRSNDGTSESGRTAWCWMRDGQLHLQHGLYTLLTLEFEKVKT